MKTALLLLLVLAPTPARPDAPVQLNIVGFAHCLAEKAPSVDLAGVKAKYRPDHFDFLLPYLAFYPSKWPALIKNFRAQALRRWSGDLGAAEEKVAYELFDASTTALTPNRLYESALKACGSADALCALLLSHNVLRTFGRHDQAIDGNQDLNPEWFKRAPADWIERSKRIAGSLISLRVDGKGDRWGEWYHSFGILTYAVHEAASSGSVDNADFVAQMNQLLNPLLAGGQEEPEKARIDRDAVEVAKAYLKGLHQAQGSCSERRAYVASMN